MLEKNDEETEQREPVATPLCPDPKRLVVIDQSQMYCSSSEKLLLLYGNIGVQKPMTADSTVVNILWTHVFAKLLVEHKDRASKFQLENPALNEEHFSKQLTGHGLKSTTIEQAYKPHRLCREDTWCKNEEGLTDFETFIACLDAYRPKTGPGTVSSEAFWEQVVEVLQL